MILLFSEVASSKRALQVQATQGMTVQTLDPCRDGVLPRLTLADAKAVLEGNAYEGQSIATCSKVSRTSGAEASSRRAHRC